MRGMPAGMLVTRSAFDVQSALDQPFLFHTGTSIGHDDLKSLAISAKHMLTDDY